MIRGATGTLLSRERWREPGFARVPLTLAHLLLFHRRLDGCSHTTRAPAPVKIRCKSEQMLSVQLGRKRPRESVAGARVSLLREKDPFRIPTYEKLLDFPRSPPGSLYFHGGRKRRGRDFAGAHNVTCGDMCVRAPGPQLTGNRHCRMHIALPAHHSSLRTVCKTHCQMMCS